VVGAFLKVLTCFAVSTDDLVLESVPLGFPWVTVDPFLFCVYHDDAYPAGNAQMGPKASLAGRNMGQDFDPTAPFRMYHGHVVPGFPQHPHRGFETVTVVRKGLIDHSDSLGATARFGGGDTQWLTAGEGIVHSEMFPLVHEGKDNPLELFQIWLNLPAEDKFAKPHFSMLWSEDIPTLELRDGSGKLARVTVVAGAFGETKPLSPPPKSWASRKDADVAIWTLYLEPGATLTLPPAASGDTVRTLYFFHGDALQVGAKKLAPKTANVVRADAALPLVAGSEPCEVLVLQGRPIDDPVVQHGPFVMNTRQEIEQAIGDYRRTRFGGWPWPKDDPVHARDKGRFAKHADGKIEER